MVNKTKNLTCGQDAFCEFAYAHCEIVEGRHTPAAAAAARGGGGGGAAGAEARAGFPAASCRPCVRQRTRRRCRSSEAERQLYARP